jgi:hypothetical protein
VADGQPFTGKRRPGNVAPGRARGRPRAMHAGGTCCGLRYSDRDARLARKVRAVVLQRARRAAREYVRPLICSSRAILRHRPDRWHPRVAGARRRCPRPAQMGARRCGGAG